MRLWIVVVAIAASCAKSPEIVTSPVQPASVRGAESTPDPLSEPALRQTIEWLCHPDRRGRGFDSPEADETATWLARRFEGLGYQVTRQPIPASGGNVIAVKPGAGSTDEAIVVSAHYDHLGVDGAGQVYWGADDNASGVAALVALAEWASTRSFDRTILFISFGAEEKGLVGSGEYIRAPIWPLDRTAAVINFDMIGRRFFERGAARPDTAAVIGLEEDDGARAAATAAAREQELNLVTASAHLVELFGFDDRTDEWWFRRRGIVSIHFSTGMHGDYHRPSDTVDRLVYSQIRKITEVAAATMSYLADAPRIPSRRGDSAE